MLRSAIDASDAERRRIARDLHDGVVQDLAGTAFSVSALLPRRRHREATRPTWSRRRRPARLAEVAALAAGRDPPARAARRGLAAALADLIAPAAGGRHPGLGQRRRAKTRLGRGGRPGLAGRAGGRPQRDAALRRADAGGDGARRRRRQLSLEVVDDGVGFDPDNVRDPDRYGLRGLRSLVRDNGGDLEVGLGTRGGHDSADGGERHVTNEPTARRSPDPIIRVVLVDDHAMIRAGLEQLLTGTADIEVVGQAEDGAQAIAVVESLRPDVVLMDLQMPGVDGVDRHPTDQGARPRRGRRRPRPDVLLRRRAHRGRARRRRRRLPAEGRRPRRRAATASARSAAAGPRSTPGPPGPCSGPRADSRHVQLTGRETEVLALVREGLANQQVARRLDISERTVKAHLTSAFARIGVSDRTQAALWAERNGVVVAPDRLPTTDRCEIATWFRETSCRNGRFSRVRSPTDRPLIQRGSGLRGGRSNAEKAPSCGRGSTHARHDDGRVWLGR